MKGSGSIFGLLGLVFSLWTLFRVHNLEKKLQQLGVIPKDFDSSEEEEADKAD